MTHDHNLHILGDPVPNVPLQFTDEEIAILRTEGGADGLMLPPISLQNESGNGPFVPEGWEPVDPASLGLPILEGKLATPSWADVPLIRVSDEPLEDILAFVRAIAPKDVLEDVEKRAAQYIDGPQFIEAVLSPDYGYAVLAHNGNGSAVGVYRRTGAPIGATIN